MNHVVVIMFILYLANKRPILCICSNFNPKSVTVMLGEIENFINDRQQKDVMYVRCTPPTKIFQSGLYIYTEFEEEHEESYSERILRIYKSIRLWSVNLQSCISKRARIFTIFERIRVEYNLLRISKISTRIFIKISRE